MIEGYMFEEHELIRLAATECMCNMAMSKEVRAGPGRAGCLPWAPRTPTHPAPPLQVQELFLAEGSDRLKLMVLYSGEEDEKLRRAASGTLAMLTALHPPICKRIPQVVSAQRGGGSWDPLGQHPVPCIPSSWCPRAVSRCWPRETEQPVLASA